MKTTNIELIFIDDVGREVANVATEVKKLVMNIEAFSFGTGYPPSKFGHKCS